MGEIMVDWLFPEFYEIMYMEWIGMLGYTDTFDNRHKFALSQGLIIPAQPKPNGMLKEG